MANQITVSVPDSLAPHVQISDVRGNRRQNGSISSYAVELVCQKLHLQRTITAKHPDLLISKVEVALGAWAKKMDRQLKLDAQAASAAKAAAMTTDAQQQLETLASLLEHTLSVDDAIDWNRAMHLDRFSDPSSADQRSSFVNRDRQGRPTSYEKVEQPSKPELSSILAQAGLLDRWFRKKQLISEWVQSKNQKRQARYLQEVESFVKAEAAVEEMRARYEKLEPDAIEEYCDLVLIESEYPELVPKRWDIEYSPESRTLVLVYDLPAPDDLLDAESYRYIKSRDLIEPKRLKDAERRRIYDSVIHQLCIRTLHELFEADTVNALDGITFNGKVTSVHPATGNEEAKVILSVHADKGEFLAFDLARVDPKATFKHLKGVSAAQLTDLAAVQPLALPQSTDKRLVENREVMASVDKGTNLAAMHWEDFEHMVRELFEAEFGGDSAEVRVTQASSDGGVDAIVFDSDPIRGGKIVIQAKRYTKTVGVSAVRDLYGTMMSEGAMKGILVTTSDFGSDSYNFVKDKPITLIGGSQLLHMMGRHGEKAYINLQEARQQLAS